MHEPGGYQADSTSAIFSSWTKFFAGTGCGRPDTSAFVEQGRHWITPSHKGMISLDNSSKIEKQSGTRTNTDTDRIGGSNRRAGGNDTSWNTESPCCG